MPFPSSLSESPLFAVRETAESGRGIYATQSLAKDTLIYETSDIAAKCIYREYRKEVCSQCFKYDRGREWKMRNPLAGVVFCGQECYDDWSTEDKSSDHILGASLAAIEGVGKSGKHISGDSDDEDGGGEHRPAGEEISMAWEKAEQIGSHVLAARGSDRPSKAERRALAQALAVPPYRDILAFLCSGVLCAALAPDLWTDILELAPEQEPYVSPFAIKMHTISYCHLVSSLPSDLLPHINPAILRTLAQRSAHNVFNIWSQDLNLCPETTNSSDTEAGGTAGGSECLGYGLWPYASYFNHSCIPNVRKQRVGRTWKFWAARTIEKGEQLCITYLGGDERNMTRKERMERLKMNWGFDCACEGCRE